LLVSSLKIEEGQVRLTDASFQPPVDVTIHSVDATIRNLSLSRPVEVQARLALFSQQPNLELSGRFHAPTRDHPALVEAFRLQTDLGRLDARALAQSVPSITVLTFLEQVQGVLTVEIDRWSLDRQGLAELAASIRLTNGRLALAQAARAFEDVTLEAVASAARIELKRCSAKAGSGTLSATGTIEHLATRPHATLQAAVENVVLQELLPQVAPDEPRVQGRLVASFQGTADGLTAAELSRSLSGSGRVQLSELQLVNLNVLREVFQRLSMLPGLVNTLQARLPASYQDKLTARDTAFQPVDLSVTATDGALVFQDFQLTTESFAMRGTGSVGWDGALSSRAMLRIEPELSSAIMASVQELQTLSDADGALLLPVVMQGTLPRVAVLPDLEYIAKRLIIRKTEELFTDLLKKALEPEGATN